MPADVPQAVHSDVCDSTGVPRGVSGELTPVLRTSAEIAAGNIQIHQCGRYLRAEI